MDWQFKLIAVWRFLLFRASFEKTDFISPVHVLNLIEQQSRLCDTLVSGRGVTETGLGSHRGGTASYIHLIQATGGLYHLCTHKKVMEFSLTL